MVSWELGWRSELPENLNFPEGVMRRLQIPSQDGITVLCKRGSERGKPGESLPSVHGYSSSQEGHLLSLGPLPLPRPGMVRGRPPGVASDLTLCSSMGRFGALATMDMFCCLSAHNSRLFSRPHSLELAHDQFQNETFVCQTCTAVTGPLLVCCIACHLLAPFPEKKRKERS